MHGQTDIGADRKTDTLPAKANHSDGYTAIEINRGRETDHRLPGPAPVIPLNKTAVTAIRFLSWQNYTRVMLELSQDTRYEVRRLKEDPAKGVPARLYVDIQGARVAMTSKDAIPVDDGLLSQVRIGQYSEDIVRVVLDMTNLGAHNAFVLPGPYRLVIDIYGQKALAPTAPIVAPAIKLTWRNLKCWIDRESRLRRLRLFRVYEKSSSIPAMAAKILELSATADRGKRPGPQYCQEACRQA